ncbi:transcriptional regulator domain-containing protein [Bradyrhizobium pachyrhizi]|uniref:transcriptional regulator domain-containing protein n=1 Tax=Bradyrhizobium pachyrhizi TaxID=280333 RepID=UPI003D9B6C33
MRGNCAMSGADWRSESAYHQVKQAEAADMAWEWLRRDAEYQKDFRSWLRSKHSGATDHFRRKWGLTFSG